MTQPYVDAVEDAVFSVKPAGSSSVVIVCEHASYHIPASFDHLGLAVTDRKSHAAWDPGALAVAERLSKTFDAAMIASRVSRLVYDCNRPPTAPDAMSARSEVIEVPGNRNLSQSARGARADTYYWPFHAALGTLVQGIANPVIVTVHSFAPVYHGQLRPVEIGILHDTDKRLADAMLQVAGTHTRANVQRNEPYGPEHGVTHTLREHAIRGGHLNVMLELRNDLIATSDQQDAMADLLAQWIADAFALLGVSGVVQCQV